MNSTITHQSIGPCGHIATWTWNIHDSVRTVLTGIECVACDRSKK